MKKSAKRDAFELYPIKRVDIFESALAQLEGLVDSMNPGDRLPPERELVNRLQISRVSVREALRRLNGLGRIETRRNSGSYVRDRGDDSLATLLRGSATVDVKFLQDLTDVRAAIEDRVVALVAAKPDRDLRQVEAVLSEYERSLDSVERAAGSLDLDFEVALASLTNNPLLVTLQRSVHQLWVEGWARFGMAPGNRQNLHAEHLAIFEALKDGDVKLARKRMAHHVDRIIRDASPSAE